MTQALKRYDISWERLTEMGKRPFTPTARELTCVFLVRWLGARQTTRRLGRREVRLLISIHPSYSGGRWASIRGGVMLVAAMTDPKVLLITLPVVQPATVTRCVVYLLPAMLIRGKTILRDG